MSKEQLWINQLTMPQRHFWMPSPNYKPNHRLPLYINTNSSKATQKRSNYQNYMYSKAQIDVATHRDFALLIQIPPSCVQSKFCRALPYKTNYCVIFIIITLQSVVTAVSYPVVLPVVLPWFSLWHMSKYYGYV